MKNMYMILINLLSSVINDNNNNNICTMSIVKLKNNNPASKDNF